jgi:DNA-binding YbaB/EbfC family protein
MNPFKGLGTLASLLSNPQRIRDEMEQLQQRVSQITAEGDAGAGMVKVRVNGKMEVLSVALGEEALKGGDREMLEDLVRAATNQALDKARRLVAEETTKMAQGLGLPAGMSLPGMGLPGLG